MNVIFNTNGDGIVWEVISELYNQPEFGIRKIKKVDSFVLLSGQSFVQHPFSGWDTIGSQNQKEHEEAYHVVKAQYFIPKKGLAHRNHQ